MAACVGVGVGFAVGGATAGVEPAPALAGGAVVADPVLGAAGVLLGVAVPDAGGVGKVVIGFGRSGNGFAMIPATSSGKPVSDLLRYL